MFAGSCWGGRRVPAGATEVRETAPPEFRAGGYTVCPSAQRLSGFLLLIFSTFGYECLLHVITDLGSEGALPYKRAALVQDEEQEQAYTWVHDSVRGRSPCRARGGSRWARSHPGRIGDSGDTAST